MNHTPHSNRLHIAIFGRRNSGKSSLVNALTGQDTALVSATPGTTTDPVTKAMEVYPLGSCLFIDTPGFDDDEGELGEMRVERTLKTVEKADVALLLYEEDGTLEKQWMDLLAEQGIPVIPILNKADSRRDVASLVLRIERECGRTPVVVSAKEGIGIQDIFDAILEKLPEDFGEQTITGGLVAEGDVVLLVMPQDIQAPKGRLILPQVQTIRELLDKKCLVMSCTTDKLQASLQALVRPPKLIITDSQVFPVVYRQKPAESSLTSFSVLFAGYKGNIHDFVEGAAAIHCLTAQSRVLIAEACTHAPLAEDIGKVKIPRLLRKRVGGGLQIDFVSGSDFPKDLSRYDLIIHCGACMFNRKYVLNRIAHARAQHIPITNYGVVIASLTGILDKIVIHR
ncbi:[FeFe] hydrogenase H-cluster maturation GTPase HydF [Bacteroides muris (ex Afrizal et al. 2022)]|uniref:[FeFe] hydrogenase H-cluster maturation GTPase HydF n=1 Tax=Bacteroides muris (ex Afrizal et al. 2022) TaxID=2516960 RepID=A0A4S2AV92_9BACE|nr:[FeFe] hydrogenase H-cluster maturation GTPase HydF [Bacteroides muris (ex Afrizal et al. 2022)]TGY04922.1 [FeFe] hydrogenase H-cluster maturation GTPase HydF [Bacteroides muris (ex Afrizal et al. 2022)]